MAIADEVMEPIDDLVVGDLLRRAVEVTRQIGDVTRVGLLGALGQTADDHVPLVFFS